MTWSRLHWTVGAIALAIFPLLGAYMRYVAVVPELADGPRMVFRSRHIYVMLAALANLALSSSRPERWFERLASVIVLVAPAPAIAAFFLEPSMSVHAGPWTAFTMRALFGAAVLVAFARAPWRTQRRGEKDPRFSATSTREG